MYIGFLFQLGSLYFYTKTQLSLALTATFYIIHILLDSQNQP